MLFLSIIFKKNMQKKYLLYINISLIALRICKNDMKVENFIIKKIYARFLKTIV